MLVAARRMKIGDGFVDPGTDLTEHAKAWNGDVIGRMLRTGEVREIHPESAEAARIVSERIDDLGKRVAALEAELARRKSKQ